LTVENICQKRLSNRTYSAASVTFPKCHLAQVWKAEMALQ
jgi:hypothetical protein